MKNKDGYLISVIIPTLNEERFIGNLFKSLERQTYKSFEIIVVDGGSSDRTLKIAKEYNVKTIVKPKTPEYESRNIGARTAKGQILLFTSADIVFPKGTLSDILEQFAQDRALSAICGSGIMYDAPTWARIEYDTYYGLLHVWARVTRDFHGSTNLMAVRKKDFDEMQGFKKRFDSDGNFLNQLGKEKKVRLTSTKIMVSGRRATRMGFFEFNNHFLHLIDIFLPFLRETKLMNSLKSAAKDKRLEALNSAPQDESKSQ
ncbi:MAG TPA: glycosyltransferase [Candidatus Bathyarchaeia archaeon]|nr:glycosyltransferase [Candidatus Bathyarchaeia archaeon]